ncbi:MAG: 4Fe-4S binding protein [Bacteroidetes bacterium]|nr:4Fe-4S binding protein [Bacteroidota bacterium]
MSCMRQCPTQAIRVHNGKSTFSNELCIDCGGCISACPSSAIVPSIDHVENISHFKYKIILPTPVLYSQFDPRIHPYVIQEGLRQLGFDEVVNLTLTSAILTRAMKLYLRSYRGRRPLISSYCPSIVRLIQVKYPDLVELIIPIDVPREIAAREIRMTYPRKLGLKPEDLGLFYVSNCPAKIVAVRQPAERQKSWFDGVHSIREIYSALVPIVNELNKEFDPRQIPDDFSFGVGWISSGTLTRSLRLEKWLVVAGLDNVIKIFDDIETSRIRDIDFIEATAHMLGCVSGTFNVENPYVARANSMKQAEKYDTPLKLDEDAISRQLEEGRFYLENSVLPRPLRFFDTDLEISIKRMRERERVFNKLPQIDCGCCGAPTCMAFAEDFVHGLAELSDCIFLRPHHS